MSTVTTIYVCPRCCSELEADALCNCETQQGEARGLDGERTDDEGNDDGSALRNIESISESQIRK